MSDKAPKMTPAKIAMIIVTVVALATKLTFWAGSIISILAGSRMALMPKNGAYQPMVPKNWPMDARHGNLPVSASFLLLRGDVPRSPNGLWHATLSCIGAGRSGRGDGREWSGWGKTSMMDVSDAVGDVIDRSWAGGRGGWTSEDE